LAEIKKAAKTLNRSKLKQPKNDRIYMIMKNKNPIIL
jgi:hypothetical protein